MFDLNTALNCIDQKVKMPDTPPILTNQVDSSPGVADSVSTDQRQATPSPRLTVATGTSNISVSHAKPATTPPQLTSTQTSTSQSERNVTSTNPQQFCLRWNNYQTNLTSVFDQLLQNESFVDVTLACDGNSIKAHKMVLSACSPYFQSLFFDNPCQHPIIIMRDVKWPEMKAAVEFMYKGEINVSQEQIGPLLRVAEMLKIRGLADVNGDTNLSPTQSSVNPSLIDSNIKQSSEIISAKKQRLTTRSEWDINNVELAPTSTPFPTSGNANVTSRNHRKRRWPSASSVDSLVRTSTPENTDIPSPAPVNSSSSVSHPPTTPTPIPPFPIPAPLDSMSLSSLGITHSDDMEIKPGIAEMIREEERVSFI